MKASPEPGQDFLGRWHDGMLRRRTGFRVTTETRTIHLRCQERPAARSEVEGLRVVSRFAALKCPGQCSTVKFRKGHSTQDGAA